MGYPLVGGVTPSEKYESRLGLIFPNIWKNKTCTKPQTNHMISKWQDFVFPGNICQKQHQVRRRHPFSPGSRSSGFGMLLEDVQAPNGGNLMERPAVPLRMLSHELILQPPKSTSFVSQEM